MEKEDFQYKMEKLKGLAKEFENLRADKNTQEEDEVGRRIQWFESDYAIIATSTKMAK